MEDEEVLCDVASAAANVAVVATAIATQKTKRKIMLGEAAVSKAK